MPTRPAVRLFLLAALFFVVGSCDCIYPYYEHCKDLDAATCSQDIACTFEQRPDGFVCHPVHNMGCG